MAKTKQTSNPIEALDNAEVTLRVLDLERRVEFLERELRVKAPDKK
jgi:hypothetical protein